jgi:prepilin-type N-terminal cleavage/methylation domain-containing protein
MHPHPEHPLRDSKAGFTVVELVIVIVVLGIVSAYAVMKGVSSAELSLPSQAQTLASDIRHAQTLAYTSGKHMQLKIFPGVNGTYNVFSCVTVNGVVTLPCVTVVFSGGVQNGVDLEVTTGPNPLDFTSLGQPSAAASYTLTSGSGKVVSVAALTGLVTVSP